MRRWNGWGDESERHAAPPGLLAELERLIGPAEPPRDQSLEGALAQVGPSRLAAHPLISTTPEDRLRHARGQSFTDLVALRSGAELSFPDGVARPSSRAEVVELVAHANTSGARLIPIGGSTSVVGGVNPQPGERPTVALTLARLATLESLDEVSGIARFGAGATGPAIEAALQKHRLTLGHYPQSFELSTLGGWVATRSSGQQSLYYGRIERLFAGGTVVTPSGVLALPEFPASAAGPDLRELVLGSEGRLGVITDAAVRVTPIPEHETFEAVFFPSFAAGAEAARALVQARVPLSMLRLSTAVETAALLLLAGHARALGLLSRVLTLRGAGVGRAMMLLGFSGSAALVRAAGREARALVGKHRGVRTFGGVIGTAWPKTRFRAPYLRDQLWERGYGVDTMETATTWAKVEPTLAAIEDAIRLAAAEENERIHVFTHLSHVYSSGSSIYTTVVFRIAPTPEATVARWRRLKTAASRAIVAQGATISHQHGVGTDHRPYLEAEKGPLGLKTLAAAMRELDPTGMMNPGTLV
jgi:alkyldihydroxyacetonephosphate synthase